MIQLRKTRRLRIHSDAAPRPPFWSRSTIAPAWPPAHHDLAIDFASLTAGAPPRTVEVCADPHDRLARERQRLPAPAVVDARGIAEPIYRGGAAASRFCHGDAIGHTLVFSAGGPVPEPIPDGTTVAIVAWPADIEALAGASARLASAHATWGFVVPVMFPATTDLGLLGEIASVGSANGAAFLGSVSIDADPAARRRLAAATGVDEEGYSLLFHGEVDTLQLATERHVAALAHDLGMIDFATPSNHGEATNWNAAVALAIAGTRLVGMQRNVELGWEILRASAHVATLEKPLVTIAEHASLSIVESLPETAVDCLDEWLATGSSSFFRRVDDEWRLRRDAGV